MRVTKHLEATLEMPSWVLDNGYESNHDDDDDKNHIVVIFDNKNIKFRSSLALSPNHVFNHVDSFSAIMGRAETARVYSTS